MGLKFKSATPTARKRSNSLAGQKTNVRRGPSHTIVGDVKSGGNGGKGPGLERRPSRVRPVLAAALVVGVTAVVAGCNTVEGAGRDIEAAGEGISDAADGD